MPGMLLLSVRVYTLSCHKLANGRVSMCQHCNLIGQQAGALVASMGYVLKFCLESEPVSSVQVAPL